MSGKDKPGATSDRLEVGGGWGQAIKRALSKKRPSEGWPERPVKKRHSFI